LLEKFFGSKQNRIMNLLSDLSSELAIAILVDKKYSEKVNSTDALTLIDRICEILQPISDSQDITNILPQVREVTAANH